MENCHNCGRPYDDSFADWTICRDCMWEQVVWQKKQRGVKLFIWIQ